MKTLSGRLEASYRESASLGSGGILWRPSNLKGMGFTGCGKALRDGRPGIYPRHKSNQISTGLQPLRHALAISPPYLPFP